MRIFHYFCSTVDKQRGKKGRVWDFPDTNRFWCSLRNQCRQFIANLIELGAGKMQTKINS